MGSDNHLKGRNIVLFRVTIDDGAYPGFKACAVSVGAGAPARKAALIRLVTATKLCPILRRRHANSLKEYLAHVSVTAEPALRRHHLHRQVTAFEQLACAIDARILQVLQRRNAHLTLKRPGKVAPAHGHQFGHFLHGEGLLDVVDDVGLHPRRGATITWHRRQQRAGSLSVCSPAPNTAVAVPCMA